MTETLRDFFAGTWSLLRRLDDRRQGQSGSILGQATFAPDGAELIYQENGQMAFHNYQGPAFRCYRYRFPSAQSADVHFDDGRFFHRLEMSGGRGEAAHLCGKDHYAGIVERLDSHRWRARWRVSGPRKDLLLSSDYLRVKEG